MKFHGTTRFSIRSARSSQMRRMFAKFDDHRDLWASAVRCLAHLDALLSLAEVSSQPGFSRPTFHEGAATSSFIRLKNARHPCLTQTYQGGEYIPNDATLGSTPQEMMDDMPVSPNMLLLTGPNMGGKSTLLRQTCLVAILAQVRNGVDIGSKPPGCLFCWESCPQDVVISC